MIRKPTAEPHESPFLTTTKAVAGAGLTAARAGGHVLRGAICWGFALLWGWAAVAAALAGDRVTGVGVGVLAMIMGWAGKRAFAKAAAARRGAP